MKAVNLRNYYHIGTLPFVTIRVLRRSSLIKMVLFIIRILLRRVLFTRTVLCRRRRTRRRTRTSDLASHIANMVLSWSRPQGTRPYRPQARRAFSTCILTLLLLLCGDVECNPGPPVISSNQRQRELRVGSLNANSAVNKTDLILSCIDEYQLNVLAVTESYIRADHPTTIKNDPAPPPWVFDPPCS